MLALAVLLVACSVEAQLIVTNSGSSSSPLAVGDRITTWQSPNGDLIPPGPLDLVIAELEHAISGPVTLNVERESMSLELSLPPGKWKLDTRPALLSQDQLETLSAFAA